MFRKKLKNKKAETLIETLVSLLIAVLSVSMLVTGVAVSANINEKTKKSDKKYNEDLKSAEIYDIIDTTGEVDIIFDAESGLEPESVTVNIYGNSDGVFASYQKKEGES